MRGSNSTALSSTTGLTCPISMQSSNAADEWRSSMSLQFGNWSFQHRDRQPLALGRLDEQLAPYGPDGKSHFRDEGIDILFYRLRETEETASAEKPYRIYS